MATELTELTRVAFHEAGHAAVARYVGRVVHVMTIVPDAAKGTLGQVHHSIPQGAWFTEHAPWEGRIRRAGEQLIMISLGGLVAETILDPSAIEDESLGADLDNAIHLAGFASNGEPAEAAAFVEWLRCRTVNVLRDPMVWAWVEALAAALMESKTLNRRQVAAVIEAATPSMVRYPNRSAD